MEYDEAVRASHAAALTLGIEGHSPEANAERAQRAQEILTEHAERVEVAYEGRAPWDDVDVPEVFGSKLVAEHGGDLNAVLNSEQFAELIQWERGYDVPADKSDPYYSSMYYPDAVYGSTLVTAELRESLEKSGHVPARAQEISPEDRASRALEARIDALAAGSREDALSLGIPGHSAAANAERAQLAEDLEIAAVARFNRVSAATPPGEHIEAASLFANDMVVAAGGDLAKVVDEPRFVRRLERDMGLDSSPRLVPVAGTGGTWYDVEDRPLVDEGRAAVASEASRIREALREGGSLAAGPEPRATPTAERVLDLRERANKLEALGEKTGDPSFYEVEARQLRVESVELIQAELRAGASTAPAVHSGIARGTAEPPMTIEEVQQRLSKLHYDAAMLDSVAPTMDSPGYYERQAAELLAEAQSLEDRFGPQLDAAYEARTARLNSPTTESAPPALRSSHDVAKGAAEQESAGSRAAALAAAGQSDRTPTARTTAAAGHSQTPSKVQQVMARIKTGLGLERG